MTNMNSSIALVGQKIETQISAVGDTGLSILKLGATYGLLIALLLILGWLTYASFNKTAKAQNRAIIALKVWFLSLTIFFLFDVFKAIIT